MLDVRPRAMAISSHQCRSSLERDTSRQVHVKQFWIVFHDDLYLERFSIV